VPNVRCKHVRHLIAVLVMQRRCLQSSWMTQASWARRRPEQTMYCEEDGLHATVMGMKLTSPRLFLDAALWWKCQLPAHRCSIRAWRGRAYLHICENHRDVSLQALLTAAADTAASTWRHKQYNHTQGIATAVFAQVLPKDIAAGLLTTV
jgi:hypothetical protein